MPKDITSIFDDMIKQYNVNNNPKFSKGNWKYCVALINQGWTIVGYDKVECRENENTNDLVFRWSKNGEELSVQLNFYEQCMLVQYMEKNNGTIGNKTNI